MERGEGRGERFRGERFRGERGEGRGERGEGRGIDGTCSVRLTERRCPTSAGMASLKVPIRGLITHYLMIDTK